MNFAFTFCLSFIFIYNQIECQIKQIQIPFSRKTQPLMLIPNVTNIRSAIINLLDTSLSGLSEDNSRANYFKQFLNSTVNGGPLPALNDPQAIAAGNRNQEDTCNRNIFPHGCTTLDEIGKAFGIPINNLILNSVFTQFQRRIGNSLIGLYDRTFRGITPDLLVYLQMAELRRTIITSLRSILVPFAPLSVDSAGWALLTNLTALLVWDRLDQSLDPTEENLIENRDKRFAVRNAALCRLSNGRADVCNATQPELLSSEILVPVQLNTNLDPATQFRQQILISGVEQACSLTRFNCQLGGANIDADQYDGLYDFSGLDDNGFPIYVKRNVQFSQFLSINSLWLIVLGYQSPTFPTGITAAIVPNTPSYTGTNHQNQLPIVAALGVPPACNSARDFPFCLSGWAPSVEVLPNGRTDTGWTLMRMTQTNCPVPYDIYSGLCVVQIALEIF